jgi:hypothetical protein
MCFGILRQVPLRNELPVSREINKRKGVFVKYAQESHWTTPVLNIGLPIGVDGGHVKASLQGNELPQLWRNG